MPYRIDIPRPPADAFDRLVELGALDVEPLTDGLAAILPDAVLPEAVAQALGLSSVAVSPAAGRDDGSVWMIASRVIRIGSVVIAPPHADGPPGALRLTDSAAFGTGHHPTTALCGEALEEAVATVRPNCVLDIGTGSGVLALIALLLGVPRAIGVDTDPNALEVAVRNARLNGMTDRLELIQGGPDSVKGVWPLVVANVLAAPLVEMAPVLVQRLAPRGRLILSGIPCSLESEVRQAYQRLGMHHFRTETRGGWIALLAEASW